MSAANGADANGAAAKRVRVCVRVRPTNVGVAASDRSSSHDDATAANAVVIDEREQAISVVTNAATGAGTRFAFDRVLGARVDQAGVFAAAARDVVDGVLSGVNGTILAYGQTGAGKTFTMAGGRQKFEDRGLCARSISAVFARARQDARHAYAVRVSYVEVYNESLADLLLPEPAAHAPPKAAAFGHTDAGGGGREPLVVMEDKRGQTFVKGLSRPAVQSEEQALDLLFLGDTNRAIAEHCLNAASTRSHCIFTLHVERRPAGDDDLEGDGEDQATVFSKLHLVDLAGSERMKKTQAEGATRQEALHINKSLTFLEQVVLALGDRRRQHVPFRQSPLTNLLKDSLGGNCATLLVACVWPSPAHADQTIATLRFATRMLRVKTSPVVNVAAAAASANGGGLASDERIRLQREIAQLKAELALFDALHGLTRAEPPPQSAAAIASESRQQVRTYLNGDGADCPPVRSLRQVHALFAAFHAEFQQQQAQQQQQYRHHHHQQQQQQQQQQQRHDQQQQQQQQYQQRQEQDGLELLRDEDERRAAAVTAATAGTQADVDARPPSKLVAQIRGLRTRVAPASTSETLRQRGAAPVHPPAARVDDSLAALERGDGRVSSADARPETETDIGSNDAALATSNQTEADDKQLFARFKAQQPPPEAARDVDAAKQNLRVARRASAALALDVNRLKLEIDALALRLEARRPADQPAEAAATDEPPAELLLARLKDAKKRYRDTFERFAEARAETQYLDKVKAQMLRRLGLAFEAWRREQKEQQEQEQQQQLDQVAIGD